MIFYKFKKKNYKTKTVIIVVNKIESTAKTMEVILKIAELKNKIKELERKRALN